jgi:hypothetical protein
VGWLNKFTGRNAAGAVADFSRLKPGDEVRSGDETWRVSAVLFYRSGEDEWPAAKLERGQVVTWAVLEGDHVVRYDPVAAQIDAQGRARWNGHVYARDEVGTAVIDRVVGEVDVQAGDTLSYQVLRSADDPGGWMSVECWASGFVEISMGRLWSVDGIVAAGEKRP